MARNKLDEWWADMRKMPKDFLIFMLRRATIRANRAESALASANKRQGRHAKARSARGA
jgi:hypothetical protein